VITHPWPQKTLATPLCACVFMMTAYHTHHVLDPCCFLVKGRHLVLSARWQCSCDLCTCCKVTTGVRRPWGELFSISRMVLD